jgi:hypothetical protein
MPGFHSVPDFHFMPDFHSMNESAYPPRKPLGAAAVSEPSRHSGPMAVPGPGPDRPHVGLLILFGPEVRAFLQSGFARKLAARCRVSVITANPDSAAFSETAPWRVYPAPQRASAPRLQKLRGWDRRLHDAWMETQGHARWRHELRRNGTPGTDPRCEGAGSLSASARSAGARSEGARSEGATRSRNGPPRWLRAATLVEHSLSRLSGSGKSWDRLFEELGLDCLVTADHASPAAVEALLAAARKNMASVVLANSWKDAYTRPYVAAPPTRLGVPGRVEADYIRRANPGLAPGAVAVVGSLHLERFLRPSEIPGRAEFCRRAGLDPSRPFLCYTAAAPPAVRDEDWIVEALLESAQGHPRRPQVLLRLNPREDGERFRPLQARFDSLVLQRPCWEWDARRDWNAPLAADLDLWAATVHHAAFNVSIPSTVTLEFSAAGRLVVNVCFDARPQAPEISNRRFWDAPFYQAVRRSPLVAGAFSPAELRDLIVCRLDEPGAWRLSPPRRDRSPVEEAVELVWSALAIERNHADRKQAAAG